MSLDTDYIAFYTKNFTGANSTSGYALDICPFTFIPRLYLDRYSDERILWDFGDGTTSTSLCASHSYLFPGDYTVSLYVYKGEGQAVTSTYKSTVTVKNFITDTIAFSSKSSYIQEAGTVGNEDGLTVIRYNSWQSYNALSGKNYTINLFASGGKDAFFDIDNYNSNKYSHLELSHKFYKKEQNEVSNTFNYTPVDSIQTGIDLLYAKISGSDLVLCDPGDEGSSFAGTSGSAVFYFTSDRYDINDLWYRDRSPVLIFAGFDTANFDDFTSYKNGYKEIIKSNKFSYLNQITTNTGFTIIPQLSVSQLAFSLNGLDGIGDEEVYFDIRPSQYAGTKIPLVIRAKNNNNYPTKYLPLLSATKYALQDFEIKITALSGSGGVVSLSGQPIIVDDFITDDNIGGYWKGYLQFDNEFVKNNTLNDIYLSAYTTYSDTFNYLKYPTPLAVITNPLSSNIQVNNLIQDYKFSSSSLELDLDRTVNFNSDSASVSGLKYIQVVPDENVNTGSYYSIWATDFQNDYLYKYDTFGNKLSALNLKQPTLSSGASLTITSPKVNGVVADSNQDIWVSLYNSISSFKINKTTGRVDRVAVPNLTNITYSISSSHLGYVNLSSFIGLNTVLPGPVDTDVSNNLWVGYVNPLSSYLYKFSSTGAILSSISLTAGYSIADIAVGTDNNVWAIGQQYLTTNTKVSAFNDIVIYHNNATGATTSVYQTSGRAANITIDTNNNAYLTVGNNTVVRILSSNFSSSSITLPSSTETSVASSMDLKGIAGTASKEIIAINSSSSKLNIIDTVNITNVNNYDIKDEYAIAAGDWTGFKWIAKYSPRQFTINTTLTGRSNTFSVYKSEDRYQIGKIGEDFDATQLYKDLRYQESLIYYDNMFDGFIGTIVGNISSSPNTLGKRVYEKAHNFVGNTVDPDTCGVDALYSLCKQYGINVEQFDSFKFATPANIKRVVDLLSIKQSKLWGARNKYAKDFDINGYNPGYNDYFGKNLGPELNVQFTTLTADSASTPIVAQSKFSNDYIYINTDILSSQYIQYIGSTTTYRMSSFNTNWGWPLVLPVNATWEDLKQSYRFFSYKPGFENTQYEGVINWGDVITNLNESASGRNTWIGKDQIMEEIIRFTLMDGLSVLNQPIDPSTVIDNTPLTVAYISNVGNNGTGKVGSSILPFLTIAAAATALDAKFPSESVSVVLLNSNSQAGQNNANITSVADRLTIEGNGYSISEVYIDPVNSGTVDLTLDGVTITDLNFKDRENGSGNIGTITAANNAPTITNIRANGKNGIAGDDGNDDSGQGEAGAAGSNASYNVETETYTAATPGEPGGTGPQINGGSGQPGTAGYDGWNIAFAGIPAGIVGSLSARGGSGGAGGRGGDAISIGGAGGDGGDGIVGGDPPGREGGDGGFGGLAQAGNGGDGGNGGNGGNITAGGWNIVYYDITGGSISSPLAQPGEATSLGGIGGAPGEYGGTPGVDRSSTVGNPSPGNEGGAGTPGVPGTFTP